MPESIKSLYKKTYEILVSVYSNMKTIPQNKNAALVVTNLGWSNLKFVFLKS